MFVFSVYRLVSRRCHIIETMHLYGPSHYGTWYINFCHPYHNDRGNNIKDESSQGFIDSVAEKGVIEPVIVTPRGEKFLLLAGERRFLACQKLGLETIPARILLNVQSKEEVHPVDAYFSKSSPLKKRLDFKQK